MHLLYLVTEKVWYFGMYRKRHSGTNGYALQRANDGFLTPEKLFIVAIYTDQIRSVLQ